MSHTDPFILQQDRCDGCAQPLANQRIPCLTCFGAAAYCSDDCMAKFYPAHNFDCSRTFRRVVQTQGAFFTQRWQLCGARKGLPLLLRQLAQSAAGDYTHLYLIRLPFDTNAKLPPNHPIKKIARSAWRSLASRSLCFDALWRAYIKLAAVDANRLFVICYAPDLSFGAVIVVGEPPLVQFVQCPCSAHTKSS